MAGCNFLISPFPQSQIINSHKNDTMVNQQWSGLLNYALSLSKTVYQNNQTLVGCKTNYPNLVKNLTNKLMNSAMMNCAKQLDDAAWSYKTNAWEDIQDIPGLTKQIEDLAKKMCFVCFEFKANKISPTGSFIPCLE